MGEWADLFLTSLYFLLYIGTFEHSTRKPAWLSQSWMCKSFFAFGHCVQTAPRLESCEVVKKWAVRKALCGKGLGCFWCVAVDKCRCRRRPLVTGIELAGGKGVGCEMGNVLVRVKPSLTDHEMSNWRIRVMRAKKNPAEPKPCGVKCIV